MSAVLNTLVPVFLLILLGVGLRHGGFMPPQMARWSNRMTYWVALPALLFIECSEARLELLGRADLLGVLMGATAACIGAGYLAARLLGPSVRPGELVQASFRGNLAFVGLPVVAYSLGEGDQLTLAALLITAMIIFYNVAAVLVLIEGWRQINLRMAGEILRRLALNPLILASVLGVMTAALEWSMPLALRRAVEPVGRMALPLALISIGALLDPRLIRGFAPPILTASLIKVVLAPVAGFALALLVGANADETRMVLILLACPTASASFIVVEQLNGGGQLTAGAIAMSTVLSLLVLSVVIAL